MSKQKRPIMIMHKVEERVRKKERKKRPRVMNSKRKKKRRWEIKPAKQKEDEE